MEDYLKVKSLIFVKFPVKNVLKTKVLYTLKGVNSDSGSYHKGATFEGIEKFRVDIERLFPLLSECRYFYWSFLLLTLLKSLSNQRTSSIFLDTWTKSANELTWKWWGRNDGVWDWSPFSNTRHITMEAAGSLRQICFSDNLEIALTLVSALLGIIMGLLFTTAMRLLQITDRSKTVRWLCWIWELSTAAMAQISPVLTPSTESLLRIRNKFTRPCWLHRTQS